MNRRCQETKQDILYGNEKLIHHDRYAETALNFFLKYLLANRASAEVILTRHVCQCV